MKTDLMNIEEFTGNQFFTELIETKGDNLPAKIEDVLSIFEFSDFRAKAFKIMTDKIKKLDDESEAYHTALRSGQNWGIATIYAKKRIGDITKNMPHNNKHNHPSSKTPEGLGVYKMIELKEKGLSQAAYLEAEQLAKYPEIVEQVIENAKDRGEIPTKTAVLNRIKIEHHRKNSEGRIIKHNDRVIKEIPKAVKDYFNAMSDYKEELKLALEVAKRELFSPESINIISKKHEELRSMMNTLEGLI